MRFEFSPTRPRPWTGRYARIPGESTVLHVRSMAGRWWPCIDWRRDDETGRCPMVDVHGVAELAEAVHAGKQYFGGAHGGAFQINEFGQVLVPSPAGDGDVTVVGECRGPLVFHNVFKAGNVFDLTDDGTLEQGDAWGRPYLGIPHNLSAASEIYFWKASRDGARKIRPRRQDALLVEALRRLRPYGPVRFVVGCSGLVLTKVPAGDWRRTRWEARFATRLDYRCWYAKEN